MVKSVALLPSRATVLALGSIWYIVLRHSLEAGALPAVCI